MRPSIPQPKNARVHNLSGNCLDTHRDDAGIPSNPRLSRPRSGPRPGSAKWKARWSEACSPPLSRPRPQLTKALERYTRAISSKKEVRQPRGRYDPLVAGLRVGPAFPDLPTRQRHRRGTRNPRVRRCGAPYHSPLSRPALSFAHRDP